MTSRHPPANDDGTSGSPIKLVFRRHRRAGCVVRAPNLHFHGLAIPPKCHQDETVTTLIPIHLVLTLNIVFWGTPPKTRPGLSWFHPHVHGFSEAQVLGGASGGERELSGQTNSWQVPPERVLVIQNQKKSSTKPDPHKPGKKKTMNFVHITYPDSKPAVDPDASFSARILAHPQCLG